MFSQYCPVQLYSPSKELFCWMATSTTCNPQLLRSATRGKCPSGAWKDVVAPLLISGGAAKQTLHFVNAGANKGFAVADFLARFHKDGCSAIGCPSVSDWYHNITNIKANIFLGCGFCGDCKLKAPLYQTHVPVRVHAFELLAGNRELLRILFERLHVPGHVHAVALSNFSGTVWRPLGVRTGQENAAASMVRIGGRGAYEQYPTTSIDDYARSHNLERLDWVSLDAEGWDALIVCGATRMLSERRVAILEFEFSPDTWATAMHGIHVLDLLEWLRGDCRYTCFWQGGRESSRYNLVNVSDLSGCAWTHRRTTVMYGNVVCAHEPPVVAALQGLAARRCKDPHSPLERVC